MKKEKQIKNLNNKINEKESENDKIINEKNKVIEELKNEIEKNKEKDEKEQNEK